MQITDIRSVLKNAKPVSPDRVYTLAWSGGGAIGVRRRETGESLLLFRDDHGAVVRAGFSPDMRQVIAENADGTFSVWFMRPALWQTRAPSRDIVEYMLANDRVPYLNVDPYARGSKYRFMLRDFSEAQYEYYVW